MHGPAMPRLRRLDRVLVGLGVTVAGVILLLLLGGRAHADSPPTDSAAPAATPVAAVLDVLPDTVRVVAPVVDAPLGAVVDQVTAVVDHLPRAAEMPDAPALDDAAEHVAPAAREAVAALAATARPVVDTAAPVLATTAETGGPVVDQTQPVVDTVAAVLATAAGASSPIVQSVGTIAAPPVDVLKPLITSVGELVAGGPAADALSPLVTPVSDLIGVAPAARPVGAAVVDVLRTILASQVTAHDGPAAPVASAIGRSFVVVPSLAADAARVATAVHGGSIIADLTVPADASAVTVRTSPGTAAGPLPVEVAPAVPVRDHGADRCQRDHRPSDLLAPLRPRPDDRHHGCIELLAHAQRLDRLVVDPRAPRDRAARLAAPDIRNLRARHGAARQTTQITQESFP